jgi:hypothetical protein
MEEQLLTHWGPAISLFKYSRDRRLKPSTLTFTLFILNINIKSPNYFYELKFLGRLLEVLECVIYLWKHSPLWRGTTQNSQMYLVWLLWTVQTWHCLAGYFLLPCSLFTLYPRTCFHILSERHPGGPYEAYMGCELMVKVALSLWLCLCGLHLICSPGFYHLHQKFFVFQFWFL